MTAVGKDIDAWCTRCKLILRHTVESMVSGKITRVHCNTCRSQHTYRPHPPGERPPADERERSPSRRTARAPTSAAPARAYAELLQGRNAAAAQPYSPQARFAPNDLIAHPSFGLGVVMILKDKTKIDVRFPDGVKTLLHSM